VEMHNYSATRGFDHRLPLATTF